VVLAACAPSLTETPSPSLSAPASVVGGASGLPTGCAPIELVSPDGQRVDLTGEWTGTAWFSGRSSGERTFLLQLGDCVWITVTDARFHAAPAAGSSVLAVLAGRITSDFSVSGELVTLLRDEPVGGFSDQQVSARVHLVVEFEPDGTIVLSEDREPGAAGPRCTEFPSACPQPVTLHRVDDRPPPTPSPS
jgi:hypothetical protein